jgi:hypothetical protein
MKIGDFSWTGADEDVRATADRETGATDKNWILAESLAQGEPVLRAADYNGKESP